jgi:CRISPR-associated endonuclease/helicase Cas3
LHELPASALFIDEAHAAIPAHLWPVTWKWLKELTQHWGCHAVLASGSLARFWQDSRFCSPPAQVPNLLPANLRSDLSRAESRRVRYERKAGAFTVEGLVQFVKGLAGPRVVVLNTVQSAAVVARAYQESGGAVVHVSTALAPRDRRRVIAEVRGRLENQGDVDWTLIATSCVEAGVDFSFRTAVRELGATSSLVQLGGRANRHGNPGWGVGTIWSVSLADWRFTNNPSIRHASRVLEGLFRDGSVQVLNGSDLCTAALKREMGEADILAGAKQVAKADAAGQYREVSDLYRVIDEDTVGAVIDAGLAERIDKGEPVNPYALSAATVRIQRKKIAAFNLAPIALSDDLYKWTLSYDAAFLGYMHGVLGRLV